MANNLQVAGAPAASNKQTKFTPLYSPRWFNGLITNRSPFRDSSQPHLYAKFYGNDGDLLIDGSNTELSARLTLARRPGNPVWNSNDFSYIDHFDSFRLSTPSIQQIRTIIDTANASYVVSQQSNPAQPGDGYNLNPVLFTKSPAADGLQIFSKGVGNSLYFSDTIDQKKWLGTLVLWAASTQYGTGSTPFMTTFIDDTNANLQQLTGSVIIVTSVAVASGVMTVTVSNSGYPAGIDITEILAAGDQLVFPSGLQATWLDGQTISIVTVASGTTFTAVPPTGAPATYSHSEANAQVLVPQGGTPYSGPAAPSWSTVPPSAGNDFQGGITIDGTAYWTCRSLQTSAQQAGIFNWGIDVSKFTAVTPIVETSGTIGSWQPFTFYSNLGVVINDGAIWQNVGLTTFSAESGATNPFTASPARGDNVTDGQLTWECIDTAAQATWAAHTLYPSGQLIIAAGCLYQLQTLWDGYNGNGDQAKPLAFLHPQAGGEFVDLYYYAFSGNPGSFPWAQVNSAGTGGADAHATVNSMLFNVPGDPNTGLAMLNYTLNAAGEITGVTTPYAGATNHYAMVAIDEIFIPVAGNYTFTINSDDGWFLGCSDTGATLISGPTNSIQGTAATTPIKGYTTLSGFNQNLNSGSPSYQVVLYFPTAGVKTFEFDYFSFEAAQTFSVQINGYSPAPFTTAMITAQEVESLSTAPAWPAWSTTNAPYHPAVVEQGTYSSASGIYSPTGGYLTWVNLGPVTDYAWKPNAFFTGPGSSIVDKAGNKEAPYEAGFTGAANSQPTFNTTKNQLTLDNPHLIWINEGPAAASPSGTLYTLNGGWIYTIALVDTLDNTVSNAIPVSAPTGNFVGATSVDIPPGDGLPPLASIDPQADYVAIFRSTDGQAVPFLIPGLNSNPYTISLADYIQFGYQDTTPDVNLNNLVEAPLAGENTPPALGAKNLTQHLGRIWYSIGNTVWWTSGPDTPIGNGINGSAPSDFSQVSSSVVKLVPTAAGMIVITVADIYAIYGQGTSTNPIQPAGILEAGIGALSYNAVGENGAIIGLFTSDFRFLILDPTNGVLDTGFNIGNRLRQTGNGPGYNWNPANVYVTWYANGEDQCWLLSDGQTGWYRLSPTPSPESGFTWSPFATIASGTGAQAVQGIEVAPGVHQLLIGPAAGFSGNILARDTTGAIFYDGVQANTYPANAVLGSIVLAQPGQTAVVAFITVESVRTGTPLAIGAILDECLPYYKGPFQRMVDWIPDPPDLTVSKSIMSQRFYFSNNPDMVAELRHLQVQFSWSAQNNANDILTATLFGGFKQEA